ncbi:hypothetical protein BJ684DRAFT_21979 [Piptocephalis cylindrospora]|uniref:Uncharacterized protein n=1 Tax=Piptocephalis cylindrospora TaxID=1907219 RepID=A0A4P9Y0A5_9FUNG|nr:hypothetical protein BJ684DRAFT_21979 [Piptocephalis cylindrospora]|eukprot:RKP11451.1 hypothetical protein BJ684DRAFT_21979 [Piptocephalis cylindrospora]
MLSRALKSSSHSLSRSLQASIRSRGQTYATTTEGPKFKEEGFSSSVWTFALVAVVGTLALAKHADYVTEGGEKEHPLTTYLREGMPEEGKLKSNEAKHLKETERAAKLNLLQANHQSAKMHLMVYPEKMDLANPFMVPVGSQVDMSDVKVRTDWR